MEDEAACAGGDGDVAGTAAPPARHAGAWNKYDDAAVAGILAAARAAGASGASVRYGGVLTKVWFSPQGEDQSEVLEKTKKLQLATAQARLDELERRAAGATQRAQKEKVRKQKQKAAKKAAAAAEEQQRHEFEQQRATQPAQLAAEQQLAQAAQQHSTAQRQPAACDVRTSNTGQPACGLAPTTSPAIQPAFAGGVFGPRGESSAGPGSTAAGPRPAATTKVYPFGVSTPEPKVLYTSRSDPASGAAGAPPWGGGSA